MDLAREMENLAEVTPEITIKCGLQKKTKELNELYFKPKSLN